MKPMLNADYWEDRYRAEDTPWDMGSPSPSLIYLVERYARPTDRILIPGAGNAHEAAWLKEQGYANVFICDWAQTAIDQIAKRLPDFPKSHLLVADFFELQGEFDLILEQTFFCAIDPDLRKKYVEKTHALLKPGGLLGGLLFGIDIPGDGPPYGGNQEEYLSLFKSNFEIEILEVSPYSIPPRAGNELLFLFRKRLDF